MCKISLPWHKFTLLSPEVSRGTKGKIRWRIKNPMQAICDKKKWNDIENKNINSQPGRSALEASAYEELQDKVVT
jgi:hypothetical protein